MCRHSILYVGHIARGQTSAMRFEALRALGLDVSGFDARAYLNRRSFLARHLGKATGFDPVLKAMNLILAERIRVCRPAIVWCDKQEHLRRETIDAMKDVGAVIVFYTPDPYFQQDWLQTPGTEALLSAADVAVTTKSYELNIYRRHLPTLYMPHGYCERTHRPMPVRSGEGVDLGFIGSWDPRRESMLGRLAARGVGIRIWGYGWDHLVSGRVGLRGRARLRRMANHATYKLRPRSELAPSITGHEVLAEDYALALSQSAISPGLLRNSLYPDQHTTRTFEIPACGSLLLADRTPEHEMFFEEDKEAVFFDSEDEMIDKAVWYTRNCSARDMIAKAGHHRCVTSDYSYTARLKPIMRQVFAIADRKRESAAA